MSPLRSQLRFARQAYRSARYPGDLAAELLRKPARASGTPSRRWLLFGGVATTAAAAAAMLSLLLSRVSDLPRPWHGDPSQRALVDWLPIAPESFPIPKFQAPGMSELQIPAVERYRGLALPYPKMMPQVPNLDLKLDLPPLPDLPGRSVEWFLRAWKSIDSA